MGIKTFARKLLPSQIVTSYQIIKQKLSELPPYPKLGNAVVQIYIADDNFTTTFTINNFVSFLSPLSNSDGNLILKFYSTDGILLFNESIPLSRFHSKFIDIKEKFETLGIHEEMGIVTSKFIPNSFFDKRLKQLGLLYAHPFMFYSNKYGSSSMVHPLSTVGDQKPSQEWISGQAIHSKGLSKVHLYQCNPTKNMHHIKFELRNIDLSNTHESKSLYLPAMGVRKITFDFKNSLPEDRNHIFQLYSSGLPSPNSKPLLCRDYSNKILSMSHS